MIASVITVALLLIPLSPAALGRVFDSIIFMDNTGDCFYAKVVSSYKTQISKYNI